jgi:hypothetical protein
VSYRLGRSGFNFLFRSRRQQPSSTCNLSVGGTHRGVRVQGCPWSSVAVDVPIDVDEGAPRSRAPTGWMHGHEHLILGQVLVATPTVQGDH